MKATETFTAWGHSSIRATHRSTFEITKDLHLTRRGNCVVAVASAKAAKELSGDIKRILTKPGSRLTIILRAGAAREVTEARGSTRITLEHSQDLVVRKSNFVCSRTLAVGADKAAVNFSRAFVDKLKDPQQQIVVTLIAETAT